MLGILNKFRKPSLLLLICLVLFLSCDEERSQPVDATEQIDLMESDNVFYDSHNVNFHSLKNNEFIATVDLDVDGNFKNYYFIQSKENVDFNFLKNGSYQIEYTNSYVSFKNKSVNIIFSIDDGNMEQFKNKENNYFSVFGISKRYTGDTSLNIKEPIFTQSRGIDCHSGGIGASSCSTESGSPISGNCSVSCRSRYYACCDDTRNECICIPIEKGQN